MTLKSDAKFEEKLTLGSKNDMRNLVNFNVRNVTIAAVILIFRYFQCLHLMYAEVPCVLVSSET